MRLHSLPGGHRPHGGAGGRRRPQAEHPRHRRRRHGLRRRRRSRLQGHPDAAPRRPGQGRRPLHQRLRLRAVLQPDAGRAADRPLPARFGHEFNPGRRAGRSACRSTETTHRRPAQGGRLRHRAGRQVAPRRRAASSTRRSAASTSSSASSAAPTPTSRPRRADILSRHRAGRGEGVPDRRLRPRGGRVHRPAQGRSRSSCTWPSTPSTRRCTRPTTGSSGSRRIAGHDAADLRRDDARRWTTPSARCSPSCAPRSWRRTR